jgi:hypothetical protein
MKIYIVIQTQFEALHCWPECDIEGVEFLKNTHRHIFHVKMKWRVSHTDRNIEFIQKKREVNLFLSSFNGQDLGRKSCEDIALILSDQFKDCVFISVFEDAENGVEVIYED